MIATRKGKPTKKQYKVATIFVDHASRFTHISMSQSTGGEEAVQAKRKFERQAHDRGVKVKRYRADYGVFECKKFKDYCDALEHDLSLCGVNARWQNGIAERQIRTVVDRARTMLLHAMYHWPDEVTVKIWPYALNLAARPFPDMPLATSRSLFTEAQETS